jgi:hypothetical protein
VKELLEYPAQRSGNEVHIRVAGKLLKDSLDLRSEADYVLTSSFNEESARQAVAIAEQLGAVLGRVP